MKKRVWELAWFNDDLAGPRELSTWHATDLFTQVAQATPAAPDSPLLGFGVGVDLDPRVYYLDGSDNVQELAWFNDQWHASNLFERVEPQPGEQKAAPAAPGSALTGFGVGADLDPRVYYLAEDRERSGEFRVQELAWFNDDPQGPSVLGRWHATDLFTQVAQATPAAPDSPLLAFGVGVDLDPRVCYLSVDHHIWELAWDKGKWQARSIGLADGMGGNVLTGFTVGDGGLNP
jgi:hypothetical protein